MKSNNLIHITKFKNTMKPKTVKTTTDFVLWLKGKKTISDTPFVTYHLRNLEVIHNYAKLMATPLSLEMFASCKDGKPIKDPSKIHYSNANYIYSDEYRYDLKQYQQAKEKVLFKGYVEKEKLSFLIHGKTIEDLSKGLELTPTDNFWEKVGL